jgi:hypothetical protein
MSKVEELVFGSASKDLWTDVERVIKTHYYAPDLKAARALYSSIMAHNLEGPPVWPMLVAPPGSMKTELLNALSGLPSFYLIDVITPQAFISGQIANGGNRSPSLLNRIGKSGIVICADFSTVLAMKPEHKGSIFADLRRVYDGQLRKEYGTADDPLQHEWKGRITFVAAVTPVVDRQYGVFQSLGDRFAMIRWPRAGGIEAALVAMNQDQEVARAELRKAVRKLFGASRDVKPSIPQELQRKIAAFTEIIVRAKTHVARDGNKAVIDVPEPESSTRLAQQLAQLAKGSAYLDNRDTVDESDLLTVKRVGFDTVPPSRRKVLVAMIRGEDHCDIAPSTRTYVEEDLALVGLIFDGELSPIAEELIETAGIREDD